MYIEYKGTEDNEQLSGPARIGRVTFSKSGRTINYRGKSFRAINGSGFKSNYMDVETRELYWISGCKQDGQDALYGTQVEIDDDVREEYWLTIRNMPENVKVSSFWAQGKY
jgi:hypothetical protein